MFLVAAGRIATRTIRSSAHRFRDAHDPRHFSDGAVDEIRGRLERGEAPPLGDDAAGKIAVFVSGHTHAPSRQRLLQVERLAVAGRRSAEPDDGTSPRVYARGSVERSYALRHDGDDSQHSTSS